MKQKKIRILALCGILCMVLVGCNAKKEKVPISKLTDWEKEEVISCGYPDWGGPLVQNEDYVFFSNESREIVRIDKRTKERKVIVKLKKRKISPYKTITLEITNDCLYYIYDEKVYRCNEEGDDNQILLQEKDFPKGMGYWNPWAIKIYKNKIYIMGADGLYRYDKKAKKLKYILKEENTGAFYDNAYYYVDSDIAICRLDLKTNKKEVLRGNVNWKPEMEFSTKKSFYQRIMVMDDKLYYTSSKGEGAYHGGAPSDVYLYKENGKDKKIYRASTDLHDVVSDGDGFAYYDFVGEADAIKSYNVSKNKENVYIMPKGVWPTSAVQLIDGMYLYDRRGDESDEQILIYRMPTKSGKSKKLE